MAGHRGRRAVALTMCGGLSAAGLLLNTGTAAADNPVSQAQGQFLGGTVLGVDLAGRHAKGARARGKHARR